MSARDPFAVTLARARRAMADFRDDHKPAVRQTKTGGYLASCSCGWEARSPYSKASNALGEAIHHLAQAGDAYGPEQAARDGVSLPQTVSPPAQDRATG